MLSPSASALEIFTDGSFDARARAGGWAFVVLEDGRQIHADRGSATGLSNNSFETMAVLNAMSWLETYAAGKMATLWTDAFHVVDGCQRWRFIWRNNGWRRIDPNPRARRRRLPDAELWQKLDVLLDRNPAVSIAWCKGHSGIAGNHIADTLARQSGACTCEGDAIVTLRDVRASSG